MRVNIAESVTSLTFVVRGLKTDENYEFRVAAENKAGIGPASDPTSPTRAKTPIRKSNVVNLPCNIRTL